MNVASILFAFSALAAARASASSESIDTETAYGVVNRNFYEGLRSGDSAELYAGMAQVSDINIPLGTAKKPTNNRRRYLNLATAYAANKDNPEPVTAVCSYFGNNLDRSFTVSPLKQSARRKAHRVTKALIEKCGLSPSAEYVFALADDVCWSPSSDSFEAFKVALASWYNRTVNAEARAKLLNRIWELATSSDMAHIADHLVNEYWDDLESSLTNCLFELAPKTGTIYPDYFNKKYIINLCIQASSDIDQVVQQPDTFQRTPLLESVAYGNYLMVTQLLRANADPNLLNPLYLAVKLNEVRIARKLLAAGADPDQVYEPYPNEDGLYYLDISRPQYALPPEESALIQAGGVDPSLYRIRGPQSWKLGVYKLPEMHSLERLRLFSFKPQEISPLMLALELGNREMYELLKTYTAIPPSLLPRFRECEEPAASKPSLTL